MGKIEKEMAEIIVARTYTNEQSARRLEESTKRFDNLVNRGLARPRGYTLMTADNTHGIPVGFNVPSLQ